MSFKDFDKVINFLASADIKFFGHTCLFARLHLDWPHTFFALGSGEFESTDLKRGCAQSYT